MNFFKKEDGYVLVLTSLMIFPILCFLGLCFDLGRAWMVSSRVSESVSLASLYAAKNIEKPGIATDISQLIDMNFPQGVYGSLPFVPVSFLNKDLRTSTVTVTVPVETVFLKLFGSESIVIRKKISSQCVDSGTGSFVCSLIES